MSYLKLFLVNADGSAIDSRIVNAVELYAPVLKDRYSHCCDSAELDNCFEDAARSIAAHEREHGRIGDVQGFTWRVLSNRVISILRRRAKEISHSRDDLTALAGAAGYGSAESTHAGICAKEYLEEMTERDRLICALEYQGFTVREIADALETTRAAVWQAQSRRRAKAKQKRSKT